MLIILPSSVSQIEEVECSPTDVNDVNNFSHKLDRCIVFRLEKNACKTILNVYISIEADLIHISVSEAEEKSWKAHGWLGE